MSENLSWKDAIVRVLSENGEAMHYVDIAEEIVERQLRETFGATPASTVAANLSMSITNDGPESLFYKAGRGLFGLRSDQTEPKPEIVKPSIGDSESADETIIGALGMFWLRTNVDWKQNPAILGCQQIGADTVNFSEQRGVYLLHDRHDVVYVGRSIERPLGQRLYEHTYDRLNGRWDRFSWFGLCKVDENGGLSRELPDSNGETVIVALESILIECLEPPQNRRRGDKLSAVEFMQTRDPSIDKKQSRELLMQVMQQLG